MLESLIVGAGDKCPAKIVGVGIGGSADYAMHLVKEAIAAPDFGTRNSRHPSFAQLEDELFGLLNEEGDRSDGPGRRTSRQSPYADTHMDA